VFRLYDNNRSQLDLNTMKKLCLKGSIPTQHRPNVWKLMLGVVPIYKEAWDFIQQQHKEQYTDLKRTASILLHTKTKLLPEPDEISDMSASRCDKDMVQAIVEVYNIECYLDINSTGPSERAKKNSTDIAKVFCSVFLNNEVDAYFCHRNFLNSRINANQVSFNL
jgi:hypothetical protein